MPQGPAAQKTYKLTGDPAPCAGCSWSCAGNCGARGWPGATSWLSAGRTSLVGGAWVGSLQSCSEATGGRLVRARSLDEERTLRSIVFCMSSEVSSMRDVPGDQQEGPMPSRCRCSRRWRRKGAPSVEMLPEGEQELRARWKTEKRN